MRKKDSHGNSVVVAMEGVATPAGVATAAAAASVVVVGMEAVVLELLVDHHMGAVAAVMMGGKITPVVTVVATAGVLQLVGSMVGAVGVLAVEGQTLERALLVALVLVAMSTVIAGITVLVAEVVEAIHSSAAAAAAVMSLLTLVLVVADLGRRVQVCHMVAASNWVMVLQILLRMTLEISILVNQWKEILMIM